MQRRNALKLLAGAAALPLLSSDALALFRSIQAQAFTKTTLKAFTPDQFALVETISELIIPATDTPGAKAARVADFIDLILSDWSDDPDKSRFLEGLAEVDRRSQMLFAKKFINASSPQQTEILRGFDDELMEEQQPVSNRRREKRPMSEQPFFYVMKRLTLVGYYTSQVGVREELHYQIIPSAHEQCAPIQSKEND